MIIRSQDKGNIRNFNLISDLVVSKSKNHWDIIACYPYFTETDCGFSAIGEYSTEEKAIKVLDMICAEYQYAEECKHTGVGSTPPEFVFQMPSDEEVEV